MKGNRQVYAPKYMGCGLGGGNWEIVRKIVEDAIPTIIWVKR